MRLCTEHSTVWIFGLAEFLIDGEHVNPIDVIGHPIGRSFATTCLNLTYPATGDSITLAMRGFLEICIVKD